MIRHHYNESRSTVKILLCLVFILPLACASINYHFTAMFDGNILCALYLVCAMLTHCFFLGWRLPVTWEFFWLILFLLAFEAVCFVSGDEVLIFGAVFIIPILWFGWACLHIEDQKFLNYLLVVSWLMLLITLPITIRTLGKYPDAARVLASNTFTHYGYEYYRSLGTGGFDYIYSLVMLFPALIVAVRMTKGVLRVLSLLVVIGVVMAVMMSGYTTAIILLVLSAALLLSTTNRGVTALLAVILPLIAYVAIRNRVVIGNWVYDISKSFDSRAVTEHLKELAEIIKGSADVDTLDRTSHYQRSLTAFWGKPLFGMYTKEGFEGVSGHSTLLDLLGGGGLVCTLPYIGFLITWHRKVLKSIKNSFIKRVWRVITISYVVLQTVNPIFSNYLIIFVYMTVSVTTLRACDRLVAERDISFDNRNGVFLDIRDFQKDRTKTA